MSKHENALRAALLRLNGQNPLPVSAFTPAQRRALERFGQQTGAVQFLARGSGGSYRISNPAVFALHLRTLSPLAPIPPVPASPEAAPAPHPRSWVPSPAKGAPPVADSTGTPCAPPDTDTPLTTGTSAAAGAPPIRAHNIGHRRDSKAGRHAHDAGYVLLKAAFPRRNSVMPPSSGQPESGSDSPWGASHIAMTVPDSVPAGQGTSSAPLDWQPACASPRTTTGIPTPPSGSSRTRRSSTAPTGCPRGLPSRCSTTTASSPTCWSAGWQHAHGAAG